MIIYCDLVFFDLRGPNINIILQRVNDMIIRVLMCLARAEGDNQANTSVYKGAWRRGRPARELGRKRASGPSKQAEYYALTGLVSTSNYYHTDCVVF